ncbi:M48 family metalloprotease [Psychromonas aquimarina]|uniref:M48 family metalloprotease n=1 Tax=Psychromonas aquimarina TaxID=444919 RepID=UPI00041D83F9|nr:M48 family metalloprotease [Psychromonas aquimarina]
MKNRKRNLLKTAGLTLLLSLTLSQQGCKTTDLGLDNIDLDQLTNTFEKFIDLGDKTEEQEQAFGNEVAQVLLTDSRLLNNDEVQRYVNSVGQWLVQNSERPNLNWHFIVLDDKSFNAFAAPGGYVFITAGTLLRLNSEAELAGVLAHEMAHVLKRHYLEALQKQTQLDLASDIGILAYQIKSTRRDNYDSDTIENIEMAEEISSAIDSLYTNGLARGDEEQADKMAVIILARAGYDPYSYIAVIQKIASEKPDSAAWQTFMKRHPSANDRLTTLEPLMDSVFAVPGNYQTLSSRYQKSIR